MYNNKTYTLESINTLTFKDGEEIFLDDRNNNPFILDADLDLGNNFYEDGTSGRQDYKTHGGFDINQQLLANVYDIEDGVNLSVSDISGDKDKVHSYQGNGEFKATQHYNGKLNFNYEIKDSNDSTSSANAKMTIQAVNDAPVVEVETSEHKRKFTSGFDKKDTHYTLTNFKIIDPDTSWDKIKIDVNVASGGEPKHISTIKESGTASKQYVSGLGGLDEFNDEFGRNKQSFTITATDTETNQAGSGSGELDYLRYSNRWKIHSSHTYVKFRDHYGSDFDPVGHYEKWKPDRTYGNSRGVFDYTFNYYYSDGTNEELKFGIDEYGYRMEVTLSPIFLDLNADGFTFSSEAVNFDYDSDGELEKGAWLADNLDGILAIDYDVMVR